MTSDYERYHGVVLRELIVKAEAPLLIETRDDTGRVNSFRLNGRTGIHIKHSSKRLAPWQFTFNEDNWREVQILCEECLSAWVVFACGLDGIVCLSVAELEKVTEAEAASTRFIRVNRDRATMYRIFGNDGKLDSPKARGVAPVLLDAFSK